MSARRRAIVGGIAVALTVAITGFFAWTKLRASGTPSGSATYTVRRGELVELAEATGTIQPHLQVEVKSRGSGVILRVLVEEGDQVALNQVLFEIDPRDADRAVREAETTLRRVEAQVGQARATLRVAEAESEHVRATQAINERAVESGVGSVEASREAARAVQVATGNLALRASQVTAARADLEAARLALDAARERRAETVIRSPMAGTVLAVNVEVGSVVASGITHVSGGTALATVADLSDLRVIGAVDEAQIGRVALNQPVAVRVDTYLDRVFAGRVTRVAPLGRSTSGIVTFDVEITVSDPNANLLRSGMSADVQIETRRRNDALLVPLIAVESAGPRRYVRMADGERREIQTGETDGARIAVASGLTEGDVIELSPARLRQPRAASKNLLPVGGGPGGARGTR